MAKNKPKAKPPSLALLPPTVKQNAKSKAQPAPATAKAKAPANAAAPAAPIMPKAASAPRKPLRRTLRMDADMQD